MARKKDKNASSSSGLLLMFNEEKANSILGARTKQTAKRPVSKKNVVKEIQSEEDVETRNRERARAKQALIAKRERTAAKNAAVKTAEKKARSQARKETRASAKREEARAKEAGIQSAIESGVAKRTERQRVVQRLKRAQKQGENYRNAQAKRKAAKSAAVATQSIDSDPVLPAPPPVDVEEEIAEQDLLGPSLYETLFPTEEDPQDNLVEDGFGDWFLNREANEESQRLRQQRESQNPPPLTPPTALVFQGESLLPPLLSTQTPLRPAATPEPDLEEEILEEEDEEEAEPSTPPTPITTEFENYTEPGTEPIQAVVKRKGRPRKTTANGGTGPPPDVQGLLAEIAKKSTCANYMKVKRASGRTKFRNMPQRYYKIFTEDGLPIQLENLEVPIVSSKTPYAAALKSVRLALQDDRTYLPNSPTGDESQRWTNQTEVVFALKEVGRDGRRSNGRPLDQKVHWYCGHQEDPRYSRSKITEFMRANNLVNLPKVDKLRSGPFVVQETAEDLQATDDFFAREAEAQNEAEE
jgi:hypothetical protein